MFLPRAIVHLDADAFFASVEQAADPRLRGKPIAVGGEKRGIIASASYEARKFGVYTPMPSSMARRLCPKLILLPGDFEKYELFSRLMFSYAYDFTPDVEIGSIDEGYFDLTGTRRSPRDIATTIRDAIRQSLKLSVSEGVAANKLVSQIASKLRKPHGFECVPPMHEAGFLSPLANQWLPGVGPKTSNQLNAAGLAHIGQIAQTPVDLLGLIVGRQAPQLRNFSLGIDERPVIPVRAPAKSYGEQETFGADTTDEEFLEATLRRMADKLMAKVREDGKSIRTLAVKVRYNDMEEEQASESLAEPTHLETDIYSTVSALLRKAWRRRVSLRLVSLKLSNVYESLFRASLALDVDARTRAAQERLAGTVDELRQKFGRSVVQRGHDFVLLAKRSARDATLESPKRTAPTGLSAQASPPAQQFPATQSAKNTGGTPPVLSRPPAPHNLAIVQRQRIGNSFARVITSPGPELRFRIESRPSAPRSLSTLNPHPSTTYVPLNVHSYYSFLDATLSPRAVVELAQRHQLPAIALTDKSNLHGAVEFAQLAAAAGIKPILGAELAWHGRRLCLYVQNENGYRNLCRILNRQSGADMAAARACRPRDASGESKNIGHTTAPRQIDFDQVDTDGLLAVSSRPELARFFPKRFYWEVDNVDVLKERPGSLPCVATLPVHYDQPADRSKYDIVQSIRTLTLLRQQHPEKHLDGQYHFRSPPEMRKLFAGHPELLAHSVEIAERCSFTIQPGQPQFPAYPPPEGLTAAAFLRQLVMKGLRWRYPANFEQLQPQLEEELAIITDVGYEEYFLIMWDILQECRRRGIDWITRGSAADSLACYCLEISGVCPIRFDLYFRRFLNKDRMALNKLPDIDVDFPHDRKDDVIDLIFEKYGPDHAAVVGGFSTFQSRSAFAEVAKVLGVSEFQVRRLTERLPHFSRASELSEVVADTLECRDLPLDQEPYSTALRMAQFLDGFPRYPKMHPCGLVLSRQPLDEITPCFVSAKGYPTTHFDMDSVEAVGLIKMDILAQGGLAVMRDVEQMVRERKCTTENTELQLQEAPYAGSAGQGRIERPSPRPSPGGRGRYKIQPSQENQSCEDQPLEKVKRSEYGPRFNREQASKNRAHGAPFRQHEDVHPLLLGRGLGEGNCFSPTPSVFNLPSTSGPFSDANVWDLIADGGARAVHHIESPAMVSLCKMCNVRDIDTLIAIVSVIRPGAANESKKMEFARRYQGLSPVHYPHPSLERCLRSTYGLVVYEEHILQMCEAFAGLPPGRADILRRALAKEKTELIEQIQTEFAECARRLGRSEPDIVEVWNLVTGFRGYAFCKAHSTAYGVEAYQSAWLKLHYPAEFMAAVLTNGKGFYNPLVYILECHRLGIPLLPPSVNQPGPQFTVVSPSHREERAGGGYGERGPHPSSSFSSALLQAPSPQPSPPGEGERSGADLGHGTFPYPSSFPCPAAIRVPVLLVKGLTQRTKDVILRERERDVFSSLTDFCLRVQPLAEEMEPLIRVGAFDIFGQSRTAQYWAWRAAQTQCWRPVGMRKEQSENERSADGQCNAQLRGRGGSLSGAPLQQLHLLPPGDLDRLPSVPLIEPTRLQRLQAEEEFLGYPVSGHPLDLFPETAWETYCPVNRIGEYIGQQIVTCGLVIEQRMFHQATGEPMKFLTIADRTGIIETELFARTYQSYGLNTIRYRVLEIAATVEPYENNRGHTLRVLRAGKPRTKTPA
jgi:DNA polymerase III alpha subunit/nucleotidyltransferase/DNA polymerase involved in DNA repair